MLKEKNEPRPLKEITQERHLAANSKTKRGKLSALRNSFFYLFCYGSKTLFNFGIGLQSTLLAVLPSWFLTKQGYNWFFRLIIVIIYVI